MRRDVGVLFQNPENQIVGENVEEDLAFGLENIGLPSAEIAVRVEEMLATFDLQELRHRQPHLLSGGQKQRVALAGVLTIPRRVLVLDEPTAMLDPAGRDDVLAAVTAAHAGGLTVVLVTQEMDEVLGADKVVALEGGAAVFAGAPADLFADAALVRRLSLGLPAAGEVALALQARAGWRGACLPLTIDELVAGLGAGSETPDQGPAGTPAGTPAENSAEEPHGAKEPPRDGPDGAPGTQGSLW